MKRRTSFALLVTANLLAGGAWLIAQDAPTQQSPVFRAGTDLVDVAVLDSRRRPVRNLTAEDFTIFENGQARSVETFTFVDLPDRATSLDAAWTTEVAPDVVTNGALAEEGRLVVILMDRTIPVGHPSLTAREVATATVNELGPGDMAAVISTGGGVPQNFTSNRALLLRAIDRGGFSSQASAESREIDERVHGVSSAFTTLTDGRCLCGLCVPETITRVADALEGITRRRKSLLFIGSDFVVQAGPQLAQAELGCGHKLEDAREAMFTALDRSGVTVHAVDPSGLNLVGPTTSASSTLSGGAAAVMRPRTVQENLVKQDNLRVVTQHTGGRTIANTNAPQSRIPEILRESGSYYLLGFRPADPDPSRPVRSIDVKVRGRNLEVRSRRMFSTVPPPPRVADANSRDSALSGLLPTTQPPLAVHLSTFATPGGGRSTVVAAISLDSFASAGESSTRMTPLEVTVAAFDATGRSRASARQSLDLEWPAAGLNTRARTEAITHLALEPGDYEVRVAVSNTQTEQASSVFSYVSVPAFGSLPLALSTIVINASQPTMTVPREALQSLLPVMPTTVRVFRRSDGPVGAFLRIYQGVGRQDELHDTRVGVRIVDSSDRTVRDQVIALEAGAFHDRTAECRITLPIPLLLPGDYLLRLEAQMEERVAGRVIRFSVE